MPKGTEFALAKIPVWYIFPRESMAEPMAKRKAGTPRKSTRDPDIIHVTDKCCGCGAPMTGTQWAHGIIDYRGRWMHEACVADVNAADMKLYIEQMTGPNTMSEMARSVAWKRHVEYMIELEIRHTGLDRDRGFAVRRYPEEIQKLYLGYRDDPAWKDFIKENEKIAVGE